MSNVDNNIWESNQPQEEKKNIATSNLNTVSKSSFDIDIRRLIGLWPFVLLFGLLGYLVGNIYLRYITPIYSVSTALTFDDNTDDMSITKLLLGSDRDPLNDKIAYFKSPTLASKVIDSLGLQYHVQSQGRIKNKDFYGIISWRIISDINEEATPELNFSIVPSLQGFKYTCGKIKGDAIWGQPFRISQSLIVFENPGKYYRKSLLQCYNESKNTLAFKISQNILVASSKTNNVLTVKYSDESDQKAVDILNKLIKVHNEDIKRNKSLSFLQAIDFIERRMEPLKDELDSIENNVASFKSNNQIFNSVDASKYADDVQKYDEQLTQMQSLQQTIKDVEDFMNNPSSRDAELSFTGIDNPNLISLCSQYQQSRIQRDKLALTAQETNPTLIFINKNLNDIKINMNNELMKYKNKLAKTSASYNAKMNRANAQLKNIPFLQKELIDKTRFQNIKENLFSTLLQKREEAYIAKASITVDTKIIYSPVKKNATITPSKANILTIFLLVGLFLPIIFAVIIELLNNKIISKKQLQGLSVVPVVAEIEHVKQNSAFTSPFLIEGTNRSMFGEQIRSLRTNINFYMYNDNKTNYILLTSSVSGEGKSFLSMNLAKSYSLQGKKVAILEFDLRRPKISKALGLENNDSGLTNMLVGKQTIEEIIRLVASTDEETLHLFPSGPIPPNPQELLSSKYMKTLKEYLDNNYDVVVIDTPPFGIVADAQILGSWADLTLIITRFNQTVKDQILEINEWKEKNYFNSMAIIFNGVKNTGYFGYKYGYYYYKRKYGYGYYSGYTGYVGEKKSKKKGIY
jgi:capsular exopolysaccharide synthesis family protein